MQNRRSLLALVVLAVLVGASRSAQDQEQVQKQLLNALYRVFPRGMLYGSSLVPYLKTLVGTPPESETEVPTEMPTPTTTATPTTTTESTTRSTTRIALHPFLWILGREFLDSSSDPPTIEEINVLEDRIEQFYKQGKEMIHELRIERKRYQLEHS